MMKCRGMGKAMKPVALNKGGLLSKAYKTAKSKLAARKARKAAEAERDRKRKRISKKDQDAVRAADKRRTARDAAILAGSTSAAAVPYKMIKDEADRQNIELQPKKKVRGGTVKKTTPKTVLGTRGYDPTKPKKMKKGGSVKDACYHKVKASYKVFPSAYASGAIAKCRKKKAGKK